jgi:hypothetical protein
MWFATLKAHTHSALIGPFQAKETRGRCDHGSCRTSETKSEHETDTMYATQARRSTLHSHTPARNHPQAPEVPVVNRTRTTHKSPKREGARMHFADDRWDASPLSDKPESMRTRCSHSAHTLGCDECATVEASLSSTAHHHKHVHAHPGSNVHQIDGGQLPRVSFEHRRTLCTLRPAMQSSACARQWVPPIPCPLFIPRRQKARALHREAHG